MHRKKELFVMLHRMELSGVDSARAWSLLSADKQLSVLGKDLKKAAFLIKRGSSVSHAGDVTGLWSAFEIKMLEVGEQSGKLSASYASLAKYYELRGKRLRTIKSRMVLPVCVFLLALFLLPLPKIYTGDISVAEYFAGIFIRLSVIVAFIFLMKLSYRLYVDGRFSEKLYQLVGRIPVFGRLISWQTQLDFLNYFYLCFAAGIAATQAAQLAAQSLVNKYWSWKLWDVSVALEKGQVVTEALASSGVLPTNMGVQLINAGEASGRLEDMLARYIDSLNAALDLKWSYVLDWLPRILYGIVLLGMAI